MTLKQNKMNNVFAVLYTWIFVFGMKFTNIIAHLFLIIKHLCLTLK